VDRHLGIKVKQRKMVKISERGGGSARTLKREVPRFLKYKKSRSLTKRLVLSVRGDSNRKSSFIREYVKLSRCLYFKAGLIQAPYQP